MIIDLDLLAWASTASLKQPRLTLNLILFRNHLHLLNRNQLMGYWIQCNIHFSIRSTPHSRQPEGTPFLVAPLSCTHQCLLYSYRGGWLFSPRKEIVQSPLVLYLTVPIHSPFAHNTILFSITERDSFPFTPTMNVHFHISSSDLVQPKHIMDKSLLSSVLNRMTQHVQTNQDFFPPTLNTTIARLIPIIRRASDRITNQYWAAYPLIIVNTKHNEFSSFDSHPLQYHSN